MSAQGRLTRLLGAASGVWLVFGVIAVLSVSPARLSFGQALRPAASTGPNEVFLLFEPGSSGNLPLPKGEFTAIKDAIEVDSFDLGIENQISIGSAAGAGAGKAKFHDFTIKKPVDAASPLLFEASATGGHYNAVRLILRRSGAQGSGKPYLPYLVFTFEMVFVKSIDWSGHSGGDRPEEQVVFQYGRLEITYHTQNPDGSLGSPTSTGWDIIKNSSALAPPLPPF